MLNDGGDGANASSGASFQIEVTKTHRLHNAAELGKRNGLDVSGSTSPAPDGSIVAGDVIAVVNYINAKGSGHIPANSNFGPPYLDVNGDDEVVAEDVIKIVNYINAHPGQSEAESHLPDSYFDALAITDLSVAARAAPATSTSGVLFDIVALLATDIASSQTKRRRLSGQ